MPYFIREQDNKYCVIKGTAEDPGEQMKCYPEKAAAVSYLKALYANAEGADKAIGEGQGVDGPRQGDGGVESCQCPECGYKVKHDRGTPCNETKCPKCGAMMGPSESEKGGPGSGWHAPPLGTHGGTPEEKPQDKPKPRDTTAAGREVDEDDEDTETLHCVCPKCGNKVVLPKGVKCADIECTACDEQMVLDKPDRKEEEQQETETEQPSGRGVRAEKAMEATDNYVHGEGGTLSEGLGPEQRKCPNCGAVIKKTVSVCPQCGTDLGGGEEVDIESEKAWDTSYVNDLPDSAFLYVEDGEKDDEGKTTPRSKRHLPYKNAEGEVDLPHLRNALSRLGQSKTGSGGWLSEDLRSRLQKKAQNILSKASKSIITAYKSAKVTTWKTDDGHYQWLGISSMAIEDREAEIVTTKAYKDAITHAEKTGSRGELDILHLNGTDVGDCTLQTIWGDCLIEGGTWFNTPLATKTREAIMTRPDYWGMSLKFRYDPDLFDGRQYKGGIQILKRTVLPRDMAASFGTAIAVTGGEKMKMDERARQILKEDLGLPDEEINALAEKQKALSEENVVEKDGDERVTLIKRLSQMLGIGKAKEDTVEEEKKVEAPESEPVEQEKQAQEEVVATEAEKQQKGPELALSEEVINTIGEEVVKGLGVAINAEIEKFVTPLKDEIEVLKAQLAEASKSVEDKVEERLEELPKVVTVQASKSNATVDESSQPVQVKTGDQRLLDDIAGVIAKHTSQKVEV